MNYYNPQLGGLEQYVVKQNDSLYMIAKKYGISVDELKNVNHLVSNMIYPNQILFIPKKHSYTTKATDSIQGIIEKYNLTLTDISGLKVMPNQSVPIRHNKTHTVMEGDCLEDIMAKYQISPLELLKLNEDKILIVGMPINVEK